MRAQHVHHPRQRPGQPGPAVLVIVMPVIVMPVIVVVVLVALVAVGVRMRVAHAPESASKAGLQHLAISHRGAAAATSQQPGCGRPPTPTPT
jgi:hypothetical protein